MLKVPHGLLKMHFQIKLPNPGLKLRIFQEKSKQPSRDFVGGSHAARQGSPTPSTVCLLGASPKSNGL